MIRQLADHGISRSILDEYLYVQQCRNALQQLDNLAASQRQTNSRRIFMPAHRFRSFRAKTEHLRSSEAITYIQSAPDAIPPQKGFVRNTVIIWLLRKKHVISAYYWNRFINILRLFAEKYRITEKLERRMKGRIR